MVFICSSSTLKSYQNPKKSRNHIANIFTNLKTNDNHRHSYLKFNQDHASKAINKSTSTSLQAKRKFYQVIQEAHGESSTKQVPVLIHPPSQPKDISYVTLIIVQI